MKSGFRFSFNDAHFTVPWLGWGHREVLLSALGPPHSPTFQPHLLVFGANVWIHVCVCAIHWLKPILCDLEEKASAAELTCLMREGAGEGEQARSLPRCPYTRIYAGVWVSDQCA